MSPTPEQQARVGIDAALEAAGWVVQDRATMNLADSLPSALAQIEDVLGDLEQRVRPEEPEESSR